MDGEPNFDGCEYSKCGRTDKGVSAFGQVIGLRVRSNRPLSRAPTPPGAQDAETNGDFSDEATHQVELAAPALSEHEFGDDLPSPTSTLSLDEKTLSFHPIHDEIPYCKVLNRLLPPDIRVLAWCPAPPVDFSARFSCKEREYKYFFTQPAFTPTPGSAISPRQSRGDSHGQRREGYLDIPAMQEAAKKYQGLHDFRNFCKVDASKQIDNFERRIFYAGIAEQGPSSSNSHNLSAAYVSSPGFREYESRKRAQSPSWGRSHEPPSAAATPAAASPKLFAFTLQGNAFLWHQVRHMVAILFLIGQGLETPSLIDELLDVAKSPCKPQYEMADPTPLVLWNCVFPRESSSGGAVDPKTDRAADALEWVYVGDDKGCESGLRRGTGKTDGKYGFGGVVDDLWRVWRRRKMDEVLAGTLLDVVVRQGDNGTHPGSLEVEQHRDNGGGGDDDIVGSSIHKRPRRRKGGGSVSPSASSSISQKVFQGGDGPKYVGVYVPVLKKPRMESVEVINERYRDRKGFMIKDEEVQAEGWRKVPDLGRSEEMHGDE